MIPETSEKHVSSESANLFCKGPEGDSSRLRRPHGHDSHHSGLLLWCGHGHGQDVRVPIKLYLQTQAGAGVCRPCVRQGHAASFSSPFLHSDPRATLANGFNLQEHKRVCLLLVRRGPHLAHGRTTSWGKTPSLLCTQAWGPAGMGGDRGFPARAEAAARVPPAGSRKERTQAPGRTAPAPGSRCSGRCPLGVSVA